MPGLGSRRLAVALLALMVHWRGVAHAHPHFALMLPNGNDVFHAGRLVAALGHADTRGHGPLNVFGRDFAAAGLKWTRDLCEMDSDGDGLTNGVELGDPLCMWSRGEMGAGRVAAESGLFHFGLVLTHPGVDNRDSNENDRNMDDHDILLSSLRHTETESALAVRRELMERAKLRRSTKDLLVDVVLIVSCQQEDAERVALKLRESAHFSARIISCASSELLSTELQKDLEKDPLVLVVRIVSARQESRDSSLMRCAVNLATNSSITARLEGLGRHSSVVIHADVWGAVVTATWIRYLVENEHELCVNAAPGLGLCADDTFSGHSGQFYEEDFEVEVADDESYGGDAFEED